MYVYVSVCVCVCVGLVVTRGLDLLVIGGGFKRGSCAGDLSAGCDTGGQIVLIGEGLSVSSPAWMTNGLCVCVCGRRCQTIFTYH